MTSRAASFVALYAAIAIALFLLMRDHAFHPTDDGFILAYSWRVANGQVPYRDFIFERPPLTPYLHAVWLALPEGWAIVAGRLAFYVELAASALFPILWAVSRGLRATVLTLSVAGGTFLIALHNFPPMPWTTVDAVFFASGGIAAFLFWRDRGGARWLAGATTLLTIATLAKQSLAPVLALVVVYAAIVAVRRRSTGTALAAIVPPAMIGGLFVTWLAAAGALEPFLHQIAQPTQMRPTATNPWSGDLVAIAVKPSLTALTPGLAPLLALVALAVAARDTVPLAARVVVPLIAGTLVLAALLMPTDSYNSGFVIFYVVAAIALAEGLRARRGRDLPVPLIAYALVLLAGWCASLSFAYQTPILAAGLTAALIAPTIAPLANRVDRAIAAIAFVVVIAASLFSNIQVPYRDVPRDLERADLNEIYPRLGHLYTNAVNFDRHRELRDLTERFALAADREFVVFTAFPLVHFLTGTRNPLSVDWLEQQEYWGNEPRLRAELERSRPVMIVQRQIGETVGRGPAPLSCADAAASSPAFAADLLARSALAAETTHFCVYVPE